MAEIDDLLSATLTRVAQPGDTTGIADAIRARVDAGDPGTPATTSGFGGRIRWWPWIVGIVGVLVVVGVTGAVSLTLPTQEVASPTVAASPALSTTPTRTTTPSATSTPTVTPAVTPQPEPEPEEEEDAPPPPPADTTAPTITSSAASHSTVYVVNGTSTTISASAVDDVAVDRVVITWSGAASGSTQGAGGSISYLYTPPPGTPPGGTITFVIQAFDGAGNASASASVDVATAL